MNAWLSASYNRGWTEGKILPGATRVTGWSPGEGQGQPHKLSTFPLGMALFRAYTTPRAVDDNGHDDFEAKLRLERPQPRCEKRFRGQNMEAVFRTA